MNLPAVVKSPVGVGRRMPRDRHQRGWVHEVGKAVKKWRGDYYTYEVGPDGREKRRHRMVILGLKSKLKKWEAEAKLEKHIEEKCGTVTASREVTLRWFWENRYWPMHSVKLKPSSREALKWIAERHILQRFGDSPITGVTRFEMQTFLNELAISGKGASLIHKARTYMSAILDEAMEQGLLASNAARKLDKPHVEETEKDILSVDQVAILLSTLAGRDRLIFRLFVNCGFRPGELFALRWDDWEPGQLRIDEGVWRGRLSSPKTKASASVVYIPPKVEAELAEWNRECRPASDREFIFASGAGEPTPMNKRIWLEETLRPVADELKIPLVTYQILRRTFATWMQKCGTIKDVQRMLRHSSPNLTVGVYMQAIPESVKQAVNDLESMFKLEPN